jgi:hypothetical protein
MSSVKPGSTRTSMNSSGPTARSLYGFGIFDHDVGLADVPLVERREFFGLEIRRVAERRAAVDPPS